MIGWDRVERASRVGDTWVFSNQSNDAFITYPDVRKKGE